MEIKNSHLFVAIIFGVSLGLRLFYAFSTSNFTPESYFAIRQIESITSTGLPIFQDTLSYAGRTFLFLPTFHYILAFFNLFLPAWFVLKVIPNLMFSSIILIVYLTAREFTKNEGAAVFSALVSGFIPILMFETILSINEYALIIPLIFLALYTFIKIDKPFFMYSFIAVMFLLTFTHPSALILVLALLVYLTLTKTEGIQRKLAEQELIIFSTLLVVWLNFVIYRFALLSHGSAVIWQNIPTGLLSELFTDLNLLQAVTNISVIPFLMAVFVVYRYVFVQRSAHIYLFTSFAITMFLLLWLRLIEFNIGVMLIGVVVSILSAQFFALFSDYLKKTRAHSFASLVTLLLVVVVFISSIIPTVIFSRDAAISAVSDEQIKAYEWIKENTARNSVIASSLTEGHLVTAIAQRKNIADSKFLLIRDANQRLEDLETIYSTSYQTTALRSLDRYGVDYIVLSDMTRNEFGIIGLSYDNNECFKVVYSNSVQIIQNLCELET